MENVDSMDMEMERDFSYKLPSFEHFDEHLKKTRKVTFKEEKTMIIRVEIHF